MSQISSICQSPSATIPYDQLRAVFLDAGNTLLEMDFSLLAERLAESGIPTLDPGTLARAEAAIRPAVSRRLARGASSEGEDSFAHHMRLMLEHALGTPDKSPEPHLIEPGVNALRELRREPGASGRIWSVVRPSTRTALANLTGCGLSLVIVSNSDGSIERCLQVHGLAGYFTGVLDSAVVGSEKPDPAIFRLGLEIAQADPEQTLHVGDIHAIDVVGARSAGCHAALLDPYGDWSDVQECDCERFPDLGTLATRIAETR